MVVPVRVVNQDAGDGGLRAKRPIDLVHLARQSLGDPGLEEEILRMFDQMVGVYMGRIRQATQAGDVCPNLHALKGAAAGVGAVSISALAEEAELELSAQGRLGPERVADLSHAVEEVRTFIAELLDE